MSLTRDKEETGTRHPRDDHAFPHDRADSVLEQDGRPLDRPTGPSGPFCERIGPWRLLRELGHGGQGIVYLARDQRSGRRVALKVLAASSTPSGPRRARFLREAQVLDRLQHPALPTLLEAADWKGIRYLVMEYVEGETIACRIQTARAAREPPPVPIRPGDTEPHLPASWYVAVALVEALALALDSAHRAGVVHRDLKPANVIVRPCGRPVLLDFGLAHMEDPGPLSHRARAGAPATQEGLQARRGDSSRDAKMRSRRDRGDFIGTLAYAPPERIQETDTHHAVAGDLWALGVTLYECLTLHHPFHALTRRALCKNILDNHPPPASSFLPELPEDIDLVLAGLLRKDPSLRPDSAGEVARRLRRARQG